MRTTLCLSMLLLASPAIAQTDDDFERALATVPARPAPAPVPKGAQTRKRPNVAVPRHAQPAAPGTVPVEWQHPLRNQDDLDAADKAAWGGLLDPGAFIVQQVGALPAIPGSQPLRCGNHGLRAAFTTGDVASPDIRKAIAVTIHGDPSDPLAPYKAANVELGAGKIPAVKAKLAEIARFLKARGYARLFGGSYRHIDAQAGRLTAFIQVIDSPIMNAKECFAHGVTVPTGPWYTVTLRYPFADWKESIPPKPGQ